MNQQFDFSRFSRLLRKHTIENLRTYLMGTAVLTGALIIVLAWLTYATRRPLSPDLQLIMFGFFMLAAGAVFTSSVFAAIGDQRRAAPALLLPASHLEKYLVVWLYSMPVFLIVFTVMFFAMDALALQLWSENYPHQLLDFTANPRIPLGLLLMYALAHGVALWGAIYFNRLHVIKTAFAAFGVMTVLVVLNMQILKRLLNQEIGATLPFGDVLIPSGEQFFQLALPDSQKQLFGLVPLVLAILLWAGAYVRLTEKQL